MRSRVLLALVLLVPSVASSDIERVAFPTDNGLQLLWWPRLTVENGWYRDEKSSRANGINVVVPDGETFADAESVVYARAIYKTPEAGVGSIDDLMDQDRTVAVEHVPNVRISEASPVAIADGTGLRSLTFFPPREGNWERVAYGEDGDYYIMFVVSARNKRAFDAAERAYLNMVRAYTREPARIDPEKKTN